MDGEAPPRLLAELRESEARYRALVLASSQMVWRTDPDGNVLANTDAWEEATGQAQEQSSGWGWLDVVHPDDRAPTLEHWRGCLRDGVPYEREYRIRVDGGWRWVLARAVPVVGDDGTVREWMGTSIDVDETHRAAEQREALLTELRAEAARTQLLLAVTAELAATQSVAEVAEVARRHLRDSLGARTGALFLPGAPGKLRLAAHFGYDGIGTSHFEVVDAGSTLPAALAWTRAEPVFLDDVEARRTGPTVARTLARTGNTALAAMPLVAAGRPVGVLTAGFADEEAFTPTARDLLVALATQAAQALERAQVVGRLREVAADLQQGLAPGDVPDVDGYELAAVYRAGGDAVELVGGDWYDVLVQPDGRVVLVVGDVMGRGVHAATTMAAVSAAVRAYALVDPEPAALLERLDAFVTTHAPQQFVTLLYGLLDPAAGVVRYVLAGHLAPLVVSAHGVTQHDAPAGPPLGLAAGRPVHTLPLAHGDALVVLTDGVVERRDRPVDAGLARACAAAADAAGGAQDVARAVAEVADADRDGRRPEEAADDVTVLVVHRHGRSGPGGAADRAP
ncbi:MAG TPA: SpoIIE family protein phosphatase [Kineosporiaceae bacterium]|nr:SpoIIE family protein phosphatase [Kineosporiaceae bacterium]